MVKKNFWILPAMLIILTTGLCFGQEMGQDENKGRLRLMRIVSGEEQHGDRDQAVVELSRYGKLSREETELLIKYLRTDDNEDVRRSIVSAIERTKYDDIVVPVLKNTAEKDKSYVVRRFAIGGLLLKHMDNDALDIYEKTFADIVQNDPKLSYWKVGEDIKDEIAKHRLESFYQGELADPQASESEKIFSAAALYGTYQKRGAEIRKLMEKGLEQNNIGLIGKVLNSLNKGAKKSYENNDISESEKSIRLIEKSAKSKQKVVSDLAKMYIENMKKAEWWKKWKGTR